MSKISVSTSPRKFKKIKKAAGISTVAANLMVAQWSFNDPTMALKLQLWCTIGIGAIFEAFDVLLASDHDPAIDETN